MDTQFFSSQIASLSSEQSFTQSELSEAQKKVSFFSGASEEEGGDTSGLFAAQSQLTNAQIKLAQIRGEISSAQSQLNAAEAKEAQEEFKAKQDEEAKKIEQEEKDKAKQEEELKFLESVESAKTEKPIKGLEASSIKPVNGGGSEALTANEKTDDKKESVKASSSSTGAST